jgi:hypothetical protein
MDDAPMEMETVRSVRALEDALAVILQNNFDQDTKVCLITMMKLLDNLLHQPTNPKVRTIRLANPAFHNKVASRKGATQFLQAVGFTAQQTPLPLFNAAVASDCLIGDGSDGNSIEPVLLVLKPEDERQSFLITARRLLMTRAVTDLGMQADQLPPYRSPPTLWSATAAATSASDVTSPAFNPYQGYRHDAQSAAAGENLGPDAGYVSTTNRQLALLEQQQAALEAKLQTPVRDDRAWTAALPVTVAFAVAAAAAAAAEEDPMEKGPSDGSLLAASAKRRWEEHQKRETAGLTTKAMRDLERIKKQKVYAHVQLTIQFADGSKLSGKFLPRETVATVKAAIQQECLVALGDFDLYVAPPRRLLPPANTLQQEGLVPAAKVFLSWKVGSAPDKTAAAGSFLQSHLFASHPAANNSFPTAQPVVPDKKQEAAADGAAKKGKKSTREEGMLKRMMGAKRGL